MIDAPTTGTQDAPDLPPGADYLRLPGAPARAVTWWRWPVGVALILVLDFVLINLLFIVFERIIPENVMYLDPGSRWGGVGMYLVLFAVFIPNFLLVLLIWSRFHGLPEGRLFSSRFSVRWGHMGRAFAVVFLAFCLFYGVDALLFPEAPGEVQRQTDWTRWAVLLGITLVLCPIQAASEEMLVRGYGATALVQMMGGETASRTVILVSLVVTSAIFAALHIGNPEAEGQLAPYMLSMLVFSAGMCALVWYEGGLESAIGYHIANNIFFFAVYGYDDPSTPQSTIWSKRILELGATEVAAEVLITVVLVALILAWNRRSDRKAAERLNAGVAHV